MLVRLREDWGTGANRFGQPGEAFFVARSRDALVGVCGLNVDPFAPVPGVGRLRRLYVSPAWRRKGVARRLVEAALVHARECFPVVRVRTYSADADRFYRAIGFSAVADAEDVTHTIATPGARPAT